MKFAILLVALVGVVSSLTPEEDAIYKGVDTCQKKTGYDNEKVEFIMHGIYAPHFDDKCYMQCLLNELGWMKGDFLVKDKILDSMFVKPYHQVAYDDISKQCIDYVTSQKFNGCLTATYFDTCAARLTDYYSVDYSGGYTGVSTRPKRGIITGITVGVSIFTSAWKLINKFTKK